MCPPCDRRLAIAKRIAGRPRGSKNAVDVVVERSHCPKCGSSRPSEYWGRLVQKCPGLHADGTPYAAIIRRRCLDCGQVRIDKEYQ
jgi:NMD protein affecting ribosome stability and mRNA decay